MILDGDGDGDGAAAGLADQTLYAQAGLFAFEVALAEVLKAAGVVPDAVVGHSLVRWRLPMWLGCCLCRMPVRWWRRVPG